LSNDNNTDYEISLKRANAADKRSEVTRINDTFRDLSDKKDKISEKRYQEEYESLTKQRAEAEAAAIQAETEVI